MTPKELKIAGWLAMASAFLTLPLFYLTFSLEGRVDTYAIEIQTFIQVSGTLLFIAIIMYLKKLLNSRFMFHDTDRALAFMVLASMVTGVLAIGSYSLPALKESFDSAVLVLLVAMGIVQVRFGYKLLKLTNDLGGMLKPFCYANMATGILLASVVLMPVSILVSAVSDLMLGTIFFNLSRLAPADRLE